VNDYYDEDLLVRACIIELSRSCLTVMCSTFCRISPEQTVGKIQSCHQNPRKQKRCSYRHTGLLTVAATVQQISYVCPRSAVGTGLSGMRRIFDLWVADTRTSLSHEPVTTNAFMSETKEQDAERFRICVLSTGQ